MKSTTSGQSIIKVASSNPTTFHARRIATSTILSGTTPSALIAYNQALRRSCTTRQIQALRIRLFVSNVKKGPSSRCEKCPIPEGPPILRYIPGVSLHHGRISLVVNFDDSFASTQPTQIPPEWSMYAPSSKAIRICSEWR